MKFLKTKISGVIIIKPEPFKDQRGLFRRHFCKLEFKKNKITPLVSQSNISENFKKGTLRGFHYQISPHGEGKTLSCLSGKIYDIVVDLRKILKHMENGSLLYLTLKTEILCIPQDVLTHF